MQQEGLVPDVSMYSAAISAYGKAKQPYKVMVLLEVMLQKGMMPDSRMAIKNSIDGSC